MDRPDPTAPEASGARPALLTRLAIVVFLAFVAVVAAVAVMGRNDDAGPKAAIATRGVDASADMLTAAELPTGFTAYPQGESLRSSDDPPARVDDDSGLCGMQNPADTGSPLDRAQFGYSRRTGGPFVYETVAIYPSEAEAIEVYDDAVQAMSKCLAAGDKETPPISGGPIELGSFGDAAAGFNVEVSSTEIGVVETPEAGGMTESSMGGSAMEPAQVSGRQLYVTCKPSHRAIADPIVYPALGALAPASAPSAGTEPDGHDETHDGPGTVDGVAGHSHDFFGNATTDGASTLESLLAGTTTCADGADRSAYWVPTLYKAGQIVEPVDMRAWYGVAAGLSASELSPLPNGLKAITGDVAAQAPQDTAVVGWRCGSELGPRVANPPSCPADATLTLQLTFPPCWDGVNLDSADHRSHLSVTVDGACPPSHPVAVPQLTTVIDYGLTGSQPDLEIATGALVGVHGDVFVAWADGRQETLIGRCLVATADCAAGVGPGGLPAYAHAVVSRKGPTIVVLALASFDPLDTALTLKLARLAVDKQPDR